MSNGTRHPLYPLTPCLSTACNYLFLQPEITDKYFWKDFKIITHAFNQFNQITHLRQVHWKSTCFVGSLRKKQKDRQVILEASGQTFEHGKHWTLKTEGHRGPLGPPRSPQRSLSCVPWRLCPSLWRWGGKEVRCRELISRWPSEECAGLRVTSERWVPAPVVRREDLLQKYFMSQGDVPKAYSE